MNWKHLLYIIPISLIVGGTLGFKISIESVNQLIDVVEEIDECCMDTLIYATEQNPDCRILIVGKMQECYYNLTNYND
jgi:hypothetical protein